MTTRSFSPNFALYFFYVDGTVVNYDRESVLSFVLPAWFDLAFLFYLLRLIFFLF